MNCNVVICHSPASKISANASPNPITSNTSRAVIAVSFTELLVSFRVTNMIMFFQDIRWTDTEGLHSGNYLAVST